MSNVEILDPNEDLTVVLDTPIKRGKTEISEIKVRKPNSGELRGLSLIRLGYLEVDDLSTLLPRVSNPPLTKQEIEELDPSDLMALGLKVASFLMQSPRNSRSPKK